MFIVVDDDMLGPAAGETRMKAYGLPQGCLVDALRLASNMTRKWAALDMDRGGGKVVLAASQPLKRREREGVLRRRERKEIAYRPRSEPAIQISKSSTSISQITI